ncbi:hypothetical protein M514_12604 [Trichuris suis]|uniref:Uncharacterized protein n=1 Tax=Trichuris suis TaxID=68888 RepID=A0A085MTM9_9BILA|nr:hypothetical protein M513_12604 [Trichuris suis]KFD60575.1 hypothetical protein M514_12604 [Trichuris suis]
MIHSQVRVIFLRQTVVPSPAERVTTVVPGLTYCLTSSINVRLLQFTMCARKDSPVSQRMPPTTHWLGYSLPLCDFLFEKRVSSISTVQFGPPITRRLLSNRFFQETAPAQSYKINDRTVCIGRPSVIPNYVTTVIPNTLEQNRIEQ